MKKKIKNTLSILLVCTFILSSSLAIAAAQSTVYLLIEENFISSGADNIKCQKEINYVEYLGVLNQTLGIFITNSTRFTDIPESFRHVHNFVEFLEANDWKIHILVHYFNK